MLQAVFRAAERTGPPLCSELDEEETLLGCDKFSSSPCISAKLLSPAQSRVGGGLLIDRIRRCLSGGRDLYPLLKCAAVAARLGRERTSGRSGSSLALLRQTSLRKGSKTRGDLPTFAPSRHFVCGFNVLKLCQREGLRFRETGPEMEEQCGCI